MGLCKCKKLIPIDQPALHLLKVQCPGIQEVELVDDSCLQRKEVC